MNLTVVVAYKKTPFKITISKSKTLLDLKKAIANYTGVDFSKFDVMSGPFIYDSSKDSYTLEKLNIARIIRLPLNYFNQDRP